MEAFRYEPSCSSSFIANNYVLIQQLFVNIRSVALSDNRYDLLSFITVSWNAQINNEKCLEQFWKHLADWALFPNISSCCYVFVYLFIISDLNISWMTVLSIPCSVWSSIFQDCVILGWNRLHKIQSGLNFLWIILKHFKTKCLLVYISSPILFCP